MKRTACGALVLLVCCVPGKAQQRRDSGGGAQRSYPTLSDSTQLQWLLMSGAAAPPGASMGTNGGNAAAPPVGTVSVGTLQIPEAALKEMREFHKKFDAGKLEDSAKHLEKAIKIYPPWAAAHHNLGQCYARMREYDKAIAQFQNASALDEHMVEPWVSLAGVYLLQKNYPDGESAARRALEIDPGNTHARYFLGRILELEGRPTEEAIDLLRKSQDAYPAAHLVLSNVHLKRNEISEAVGELRAYLALPNAPQKEKVECMVQHLTQPPGTATCAMQ